MRGCGVGEAEAEAEQGEEEDDMTFGGSLMLKGRARKSWNKIPPKVPLVMGRVFWSFKDARLMSFHTSSMSLVEFDEDDDSGGGGGACFESVLSLRGLLLLFLSLG